MISTVIQSLTDRFASALRARDRELAKTCLTQAGLMPGETPAALFLDALERGYRLEIVDEAPRVDEAGGRGYVRVEVVKDGYPSRSVWLLAEREDGRLGLSGVTGSPRVADAFLEGKVPADARFGALPKSPQAMAFGAKVVAAHERHGRVGEVFGAWPVAAMAAGAMLDSMVASPGTTISVVDARELLDGSHAALGFEVQRPDRMIGEELWMVLALGAEPVVLATASSMSLELLVTSARERGARPDDSIFEKREDRGTGVPADGVGVAHAQETTAPVVERDAQGASPVGSSPVASIDRIDELLELLRARVQGDVTQTETVEVDQGSGQPVQALPVGVLDAEARELFTADPTSAAVVQRLLERLVETLPKGDLRSLQARLPELFAELASALQRALGQRAQ